MTPLFVLVVVTLAAAAGLAALLVVMVPANVYAAMAGLTLGGAPVMALIPRNLLQLVFLAATLTVLAWHVRHRRAADMRDALVGSAR